MLEQFQVELFGLKSSESIELLIGADILENASHSAHY